MDRYAELWAIPNQERPKVDGNFLAPSFTIFHDTVQDAKKWIYNMQG